MSTIIQQGKFTSDGTAKVLNLRSDIDWMEVYNATVADDDTQTTAVGVQYYWQKGMAAGSGIEYKKSNAANAAQLTTLLASGGFTAASGSSIGAPVTGTTITKADPPVCTAAGHGFSNGDVVFFTKLTNMRQLAGLYFTIGSVTTNTFELTYFDTNTANFTAETGFTVAKVSGAPFWGAAFEAVVDITQASQAVVTFAADYQVYAVGDVLRLKVPAEFGMTEIDGLTGKILSINTTTNAYTLDIDSSAFTAFAFPASSAVPFTFAQAIAAGTTATTSATSASTNDAIVSMTLAAGADSPAGSSSDVIYWRAGKSFSVSN